MYESWYNLSKLLLFKEKVKGIPTQKYFIIVYCVLMRNIDYFLTNSKFLFKTVVRSFADR